jgi:hypothetical protein
MLDPIIPLKCLITPLVKSTCSQRFKVISLKLIVVVVRLFLHYWKCENSLGSFADNVEAFFVVIDHR